MSDEALSIDAAIDLITDVKEVERDIPDEVDAPKESEPDTPSGNDTDEPEAAIDGEDDEGDEPDTAIEPPSFWDKDERETWDDLSPAAQKIVLAKEQERVRFTSQKVEEAANARKFAEYQAAEFQRVSAGLSDLLPRVEHAVADRWQGIDWTALAQVNPAEYVGLQAEYQAEMQDLQALQQQAAHAEALEYSHFIQTQAERLATLRPEMVDAKTGDAVRKDVGKFLTDNGVTPDVLKHASADELNIAWKAMMWDRANAGLDKQAPKAPGRTTSAVRPSGTQVQQSSPTRSVQKVQQRFAQTGSIDDAVNLLMARQARR